MNKQRILVRLQAGFATLITDEAEIENTKVGVLQGFKDYVNSLTLEDAGFDIEYEDN